MTVSEMPASAGSSAMAAIEPELVSLLESLPESVEYATVRFRSDESQVLSVRSNVLEPIENGIDAGVMVTVWEGGGSGYGATSELSPAGLSSALAAARRWATATADTAVLPAAPFGVAAGAYSGPVVIPWSSLDMASRVDLLMGASKRLAADDRIVDWEAGVTITDSSQLILSTNGSRIEQCWSNTFPTMRATAAAAGLVQTRTLGGFSYGGQGGVEVLERFGFSDAPDRLASEALELLAAPNTPGGTMDIVLAPDQMVLQIHESIGHPLELDRILGDERNYAGTSFVTPDMFGTYQYGSELLNVSFDPTLDGELACYAFDDDGTPAKRELLIENGVLKRPLGGQISQDRAGMDGVANSRACSWNRPPIDRMANLNVEPGNDSFEELVAGVENGIYMETNNSWSIDDSRNKFQFGCEYGRLIRNGELGAVVRNPGYRGISSTFWRSLSGVGTADTSVVMGVPNCGKGEPNQMITVGHTSPTCRFGDIEVFGGER